MDTPEEKEASRAHPAPDGPEAIPIARPVDVPVARAAIQDAMLLGRLSKARAAMHLAILFAVLAAYIVIASVAVGIALDGNDESEVFISPGANLAITLVGEALLVGIALLMLRRHGHGPCSIGVTARRVGADMGLGLAVTACSFGVFMCAVYAMALLWPAGFAQMRANSERIEEMLPPLSLGGAFALMLVIGTLEELIFRGVLLTHVRRITRSWTAAVIISGVIFALLHLGDQEPAAAIPLFFVSVVWSGFTVWRRSLVPAIIGHALFNFIQFAALKWVESGGAA